MPIGFKRPTRADMNRGMMPDGTPPTLSQIKKGARYTGKPYTIHESNLMRKYRTDLRTANELEKEARQKIKKDKDKISEFL